MSNSKKSTLKFILPLTKSISGYKKLLSLQDLSGITCRVEAPLRPLLAAAVFRDRQDSILIITDNGPAAAEFARQLRAYLTVEPLVFPVRGPFIFEDITPEPEIISRRRRALRAAEGPLILVASIQAVIEKFPPPVDGDVIEAKAGDAKAREQLIEDLIERGYERVALVESPGQFAPRGNLIDVFGASAEAPVRLDFFGDQIESIRLFDPESQRTTGALESVSLFPGRDDFERRRRNVDLIDILTFLPASTLVMVNEPKLVKDEAARFLRRAERRLTAVATNSEFNRYFLSEEETAAVLARGCAWGTLTEREPDVEIAGRRPRPINGSAERLKRETAFYNSGGYRLIFSVTSPERKKRLKLLLEECREELPSVQHDIVVGPLKEGFVLTEQKTVVLGEADIFPPHLAAAEAAGGRRAGARLNFKDLAPGDYLVHENHGIAVYQGVTRREAGGVARDYIILEYAAGDLLYVPTEQLYKVTRYIGPDSGRPRITRLGSSEWTRARSRARRSVRKLAMNLELMYRERLNARGYKFSPDTAWQRELEDDFSFTETKDQLRAINEVKRDMEKIRPMDRLVCGDVGFGKTEVAIRAAFKAIVDGKQVMMLVPTTILAEQHYQLFKKRFEPYPIKTAMLSRFCLRKQQQLTVEGIKAGLVDMVIGTHRLLQSDLRFKDLGLIVIDEEQRFGVKHKEKLRLLRKEVDVLTLTATPIPRTLQISLSGLRDLSLIETPPPGRRPVKTYVGAYDQEMIEAAVQRELERGGQVYYLHNKILNITSVAARWQRRLPAAAVGVVHGRMDRRELEKTMLDFINKKIDVLFCTTIIESGLDIANANTLIVEGAENLGLAQLYQLRGRIGRSPRQAYAYFTYKSGDLLTTTAVERLKAVAEFSELGAGYQIALRDLQIRGAGNLLGPEQHGHLAAVGFEYFCRLLRQAVDELRGGGEAPPPEVVIDLPLPAFIPEAYIGDNNLRLDIYQRLAAAGDDVLEALKEELLDRFGPPPPEVLNLWQAARLKRAAAAAGLSAVTYRRGKLRLKGVNAKTAALLDARARDASRRFYKPGLAEYHLEIKLQSRQIVPFLSRVINDIMPPEGKKAI